MLIGAVSREKIRKVTLPKETKHHVVWFEHILLHYYIQMVRTQDLNNLRGSYQL